MTADVLDDCARKDAALDRLVGEPFWYQRRGRWAQAGNMTDQEWQRYQAAYAAAQRAAPVASRLAQA